MKIDRAILVGILTHLETHYPECAPDGTWNRLIEIAGGDEAILIANMHYLEEQGFTKGTFHAVLGPKQFAISEHLTKITKDGIDFLLDDGGLAAVKNTVTVRFHADAVATLERYILQGPESPEEKDSLLAKLRQLPFSATEHLMKKLLDMAVERSPEALLLIEKALL